MFSDARYNCILIRLHDQANRFYVKIVFAKYLDEVDEFLRRKEKKDTTSRYLPSEQAQKIVFVRNKVSDVERELLYVDL